DTVGTAGAGLVEVMLRRLIFLRRVAAETHLAARRAKLAAVRLVAVRARHAAREHLGLQKRDVLVDFFADLPVGVIERVVEERHAIRVAEGPALRGIVGELSAARVTASARLHLAARRSRGCPLRVAGLRADRPRRALSLVERDGESLRPAVEPPPVTLLAGPRDVVRSGAVAGLACAVDLGLGRGETPPRRVVVLSDA